MNLALFNVSLTLPTALRATEILCGLSLLIQTLEFLHLHRDRQARELWQWSIQRDDLAHAPAWLRRIFDGLYSDPVHRLHLMVRLGAAASLFAGASLASIALLFVSTVVLLIRWRGAFNGGSDFMTIVVLTGLLIARLAEVFTGPTVAYSAGLWYITLHALSSYFISGAIKLRSREWRNGAALTVFLNGGLYGPLAPDSLFQRAPVAAACSWAFILWECAFPLAMAGPAWAVLCCLLATVFHLLVFRFFGLNRFVWAWVASFPAIVYCAGRW